MVDNMEITVKNILQSLARYINCLSEENRNTRKRAIDGIWKDVFMKKPVYEAEVLQNVVVEIIKPILKLVSDPVEKCREITIKIITEAFNRVSDPGVFFPFVIPVFAQRIGQQETLEQSEELRLQMVEVLTGLIKLGGKSIAPFVDDYIKILVRTIPDQYPEVKKESCRCAALLASTIPEYFHLQSESLIKPLLLSISHQHSRVRVEVVIAVGSVLQYGNNKNVDDVVSHLAQRMFDRAPTVRAAVVQVVGNWLLDLPDRYSFHTKLIPLLLTGIQDDLPDIKEQAESLWHDVGLKYEGENEQDLKDKQDFLKPDLDHYPPGLERPNLGCRTLMYRNFSRILSGASNDISDWVVETRIKTAQLLYQLIINEEENCTQHMEKILSTIQKGCHDEEQQVVQYVVKSAELLGYFVSPEVWVKMVLKHIKMTQSYGSLMVLAAITRGSNRSLIRPYIEDVCSIISDQDICATSDASIQRQLLHCVDALISVSEEDCQVVSLSLFTILVTVLALGPDFSQQVDSLLEKLSKCNGYNNTHQLYEVYTKQVLEAQRDGYSSWTQHSTERLVFDTLLIQCGSVVGELLEDVIPVLIVNLRPEKDADVRLKFFNLLSRLMLKSSQTLDSCQRFGDFAVTVVRDMILPNCVWRAGRTAGAIRTTAISCLWALLQSGALNTDRLCEVMEEVLTQLRSTLEDDNKSTRLVSCRVLTHMFNIVGKKLDQDRLYNLYPDLLKRLDDSSDDVRVATCKTFSAYFECFESGYDVAMYRGHIEAVYKGLLIHMDDPDQKIQEAVLEVLEKASVLHPDMLLKEVDIVKHKHRSTRYCDKLADYIQALPKPS